MNILMKRHIRGRFDREVIKEPPKRIEIEPTNECNLLCGYCPRRFMKYKTGFMNIKLYKKIIDEVSAFPERTLVLFRRGEALLHPEFIQMLSYTKGKFKEVQLATNAVLMDKRMANAIAEAVDFLSFSLELPQRYPRYRKMDYPTIFKNVEYFLSINSRVTTQVSIVKTRDITANDIARFKALWIDKVDRVRIYEEHSQDGRFGSLKNIRGKRKPCIKPFNDILIFWDGKVGRCNHDWGNDPLDSIVNKSIEGIWNSKAYTELRKQHLDLLITDKVCRDCDSWYEHIGECEVGQVYEKDK